MTTLSGQKRKAAIDILSMLPPLKAARTLPSSDDLAQIIFGLMAAKRARDGLGGGYAEAFKRQFGFVGDALAAALPMISHDVVGIVAGYALEARFQQSFGARGLAKGRLEFPAFVACTSQRQIIVTSQNRAQLFDRDGSSLRKFECMNGGRAIGLDTRNGEIFLCNHFPSSISVHCPDGQRLRQIGTYVVRPSSPDSRLHQPTGVALNGKGHVFVVDPELCCVMVFTTSGTFVRKFGRKGPADQGLFECPYSIAVGRNQEVFVSDWKHSCILVFSESGLFLRRFGGQGSGEGQLCGPIGVAVDHAGRLLVCDQSNRVQIFKPDGSFVLSFGEHGSGPGQFDQPTGICIDPEGRILVCDNRNHRVSIWVV